MMNSELTEKTALPLLPFVDRCKERKWLKGFFEGRGDTGSGTLILEAEAGLGKTTLIEQVIRVTDENVVFIVLASSKQNAGHGDLFENALLSAIKALDKRYPKQANQFHWWRVLAKAIEHLAPNAVQDISKYMVEGSSTVTGLLRAGIEGILLRYNIKVISQNDLLIRVLHQLWEGGLRTILLYEDFHDAPNEELSRLNVMIDAISSKALTKGHSDLWGYVLTSRPLADYEPKRPKLKEFCLRLEQRGGLRRAMQILDEDIMLELAKMYVVNWEEAIPLIKRSKGNPNNFFEQIQSLAYHKQTQTVGGCIRIPDNVEGLSVFHAGFSKILEESHTERLVCGALSLGLTELPMDVLSKVGEQLEITIKNWFSAIGMLEESRYLVIERDTTDELLCRLSHHKKREITLKLLEKQKVEEILLHDKLHEAFLAALGSEISNDFLKLGDPSVPLVGTEKSNPKLGYFIQAAIHCSEIKGRNWEALTLAAIRLCDAIGNYTELAILGAHFERKTQHLLEPTSLRRVTAATLTSKAYYLLGDFAECLSAVSEEQLQHCPHSEFYYYRAISIVTAKEDGTPSLATERIINYVRTGNYVDKDWLPQITTAHAFAYRENGRGKEADEVYQRYFSENHAKYDDAHWHTFAFMSALFLAAKDALAPCQKAYEYFINNKSYRLAGMALHNVGYCHFRTQDYDRAYDFFEEADILLSEFAVKESAFPKIDKAYIHLIRGEAQIAKGLCSEALGYITSPFYISAARVNLALADHLLGARNAIEHLDQIPDCEGLKTDPSQRWKIEHSRIYIKLTPIDEILTQTVVDDCYKVISSLIQVRGCVAHWNALAEKVATDYPSLSIQRLKGIKNKPEHFSKIASLNDALFRPSSLCFGHA